MINRVVVAGVCIGDGRFPVSPFLLLALELDERLRDCEPLLSQSPNLKNASY
jgi:hypothetical protein